MEKREPLCTFGRNVNWYSRYGKQYGKKYKLKTELPYDPAIPLLVIFLKETKTIIQKYIHPYVHCTIISNH